MNSSATAPSSLTSIDAVRLLRRSLVIDGALAVPMAVGFALFAGVLAEPLGLDSTFLRVVGVSLAPLVFALSWLGRQASPPAYGVCAILGVNLLWIVGSVFVVVSGIFDLTVTGATLVVAQVAVVGGISAVELVAGWSVYRWGVLGRGPRG